MHRYKTLELSKVKAAVKTATLGHIARAFDFLFASWTSQRVLDVIALRDDELLDLFAGVVEFSDEGGKKMPILMAWIQLDGDDFAQLVEAIIELHQPFLAALKKTLSPAIDLQAVLSETSIYLSEQLKAGLSLPKASPR